MGDDVDVGRTGSATRGRIPVRAPSSNERDPTGVTRRGDDGAGPRDDARAAQPVAIQWVRTPAGRLEALALSPPIVWGDGPLAPGAVLERRTPPFTPEDLANLPSPKDGTGSRRPGLLALDPTARSVLFLDNAGIAAARPDVFNATTYFPALTRAVGGGPIERDVIQQASEQLVGAPVDGGGANK
jgi:hypothetical protein